MSREVKAQPVRLLDIFVIGPLMIYGGLKLKSPAGALLTLFGMTTVLYNARNFNIIERENP